MKQLLLNSFERMYDNDKGKTSPFYTLNKGSPENWNDILQPEQNKTQKTV